MSDKKHLSFSQLNMYCRCGEQYRRRYMLKEIIPPGSAAILGSSFHISGKKNYTQKKDTKKDLPVEQVQDIFASDFDVRSKNVLWTPEESQEGVKKVRGVLKDEGIGLVGVYHKEVAPQVQPVMVEEKINVEFEGFDYDLLAILDLVGTDEIIRDSKTMGKSPNKNLADISFQLTTYSMAYRAKTGKLEKGLQLDCAVRNKVPKIVQLPTQRTQEDIDRLLERIGRMADGIGKGVFMPAEQGAWICSKKWCGYWDTCKVRA